MDEFVRRPRRPKISLGGTFPNRSASNTSVYLNQQGSVDIVPPPPPEILPDDSNKPSTPNQKGRIKLPIPKTKKQWIITGVIAALLLGGGGFALYWFVLRDKPMASVQPEPEPEPEPEPVPTTEPSKMTGLPVEFAVNDRTVYAVQIENSPEARPQSGLAYADIVFEAVAEGGITRFNALFHDQQPESIGPVRSLRPYYIDWFAPFDAAIVHAGGSPEALNDIRSLGIKDLDHGPNGGAFTRVSSRYAPHNLYTTSAKMLELISKKGYTSPNVASLPRKEIPEPPEEGTETTAEPTSAAGPTANTIDLNISSALYKVSFAYNAETKTYQRTMAGQPHVDEKTGKRIAPSVVIVPVLTKGIHPDGTHTKYGTTGSGKVFVFQEGVVIEGTWTKTDRKAQWELKDANGEVIKLTPGQTWFTIIDKAASVSYRP